MTEVRTAAPFEDIAIVLLPDHLHVIWELPTGDADYSRRWRQIKAGFTRRWIAGGGRESSVSRSRHAHGERGIWQRRFWEHTIRGDTSLKRLCDYIHINPLKHGYVERVADWPWSSFHRFVSEGEYDEGWGDGIWFGDEFQRFE